MSKHSILKTLFITLLLLGSLGARGEKAPEVPKLSGIVNLPDKLWATFEYQEWCCGPRQEILAEGDRNGSLRVLHIRAAQRAVELSIAGILPDPLALTLNDGSTPVHASGSLELADASLLSVLELYGVFAKRTLLYWPNLPSEKFSLSIAVTNDAQSGAALKKALEQKQIETVVDGENFLLIAPRDQVPLLKPHAPGSEPPGGKPGEMLPAGVVNFHGVDIGEVIKIYAELKEVKADRAPLQFKPRQQRIFLRTQTPLTKQQLVYAFETLFAWQGIKFVTGPDGLMRPTQEAK